MGNLIEDIYSVTDEWEAVDLRLPPFVMFADVGVGVDDVAQLLWELRQMGYVFGLVPQDELVPLLHTPTKRRCLDLVEPYTDEQAWAVIERVVGVRTTPDFQRLSRHDQKRAVLAAKVDGAGVRQLVRLTGLGYGTVVKL